MNKKKGSVLVLLLLCCCAIADCYSCCWCCVWICVYACGGSFSFLHVSGYTGSCCSFPVRYVCTGRERRFLGMPERQVSPLGFCGSSGFFCVLSLFLYCKMFLFSPLRAVADCGENQQKYFDVIRSSRLSPYTGLLLASCVAVLSNFGCLVTCSTFVWFQLSPTTTTW